MKRRDVFTVKNKWITSCIALALAASMVCPAWAAEQAEVTGAQVMTFSDLAELDSSIQIPHEGSEDAALTMQEAAAFVLREAGMQEAQLGTYPDDYNAMAISAGLVSEDFDPQAPCTQQQLTEMTQAAQPLKEALSKDKKEPLFMNGMAQPIFEYTSGMASDEEYSNEDSEITRYCVYVETNYDTDGDGKLDLVKALVQIPNDAVGSDGKFATIFEARPYITGCTDYGDDRDFSYKDDSLSYDLEDLHAQPAARTPEGTATTWQAAQEAKASDWYYVSPYESGSWGDFYDYEDLDWYDYFLVRGYAVVEVAGLGTRGSEGLETCGADVEIDAFKCVVEWLTGDRVAYTDKTNNIAIEAEWSNGNVGMTGRSYGGTTQFGLAATGVEGLKTIVPVAGIASWYEYTNSQGIATGGVAYSDSLALYCAGRYIDEDDWNSISDTYANYLSQIWQDQLALNGDYGDHWANRDYTLNAENIQCPALIVHGLNDENVRTKQFDLMYQAFQEAGQNVKLLLHQDAHVTPAYDSHKTEFYINGESYNSILNQWFSHYLYNVDNGIEDMAAVTVQNNTDGSWDTYDQWPAEGALTMSCAGTDDTVTLSSDYSDLGRDKEAAFIEGNSDSSAVYTYDVPEDTTIQGSVEVHVKASTTLPASGENDALMMSAMLVDMADEPFDAFMRDGSYVTSETLKEQGAWMGGGLTNYDLIQLTQSKVDYKVIARGWMDLANPNAGYDSASAARTDRVELGDGAYYDYVIYLQPTVYTVEAGHHLALVVFPYDPDQASYDETYSITIDNQDSYAKLPVYGAEDSSSDSDSSSGSDTVRPPESSKPTFTDVEDKDWYAQAVSYVSGKGLMRGTGDGLFSPNMDITRGMLVTILYQMEGKPAVSGADFSDVASGDYYADAVAWASDLGLVSGYGNGMFGPNDVITREQTAAILYGYAQHKGWVKDAAGSLDGFQDQGQVSDYAVDALAWAVNAGLISGTSQDTLSPFGSTTRAQAAVMLMHFCQDVAK